MNSATMPNPDEFDVYAYGVIASSTLHLLQHPFPPPDGYAEVTQSLAMTGGEALNSSIVLSRLGLRVRLDGNWIGDTPEGERLLRSIAGCGIDGRRLAVKAGFPGVREIVFSDSKSRTIFGNYVDLLAAGRKWNVPRKADVAAASIACVDPPFREESAQVGQFAAELDIPFVSIDCPFDQPLASDAAAVIISGEFRGREYPETEPDVLFGAYLSRARGLVIFTVGEKPILFGRRGQPVQRLDPWRVEEVDSAGAGDAFRSGVVYGLLQRWDDIEIVRYASALAAIVCTRFPGVIDSPSHAEVMEFIGQTRADLP
jgi:sugar/nucleoside kinase (ribokinase family)